MSSVTEPFTAVKPGIYGLAFTMGKCFLTDNSATVGRILMISSADPHEIFDRYSIPYSQGWSVVTISPPSSARLSIWSMIFPNQIEFGLEFSGH